MNEGFTLSESIGYTVFVYAMQFPGVYGLAWVGDRIPRRTMTLIASGAAIASAALLAAAEGAVAIFVAVGLLSMWMKVVFALLYLYTPEIYPSHIRASGMGVASAIGRLGSTVAPIAIGAMYPVVGFTGVFLITSAMLLVGALSVVLQGKATHGANLESITEDLPEGTNTRSQSDQTASGPSGADSV